MLRCAKNENGVIKEIGNDEGQSGQTVSGNTWCTWTLEDSALPAFSAIEGAEERAMRFEENLDGDGIALRSDEDVLALPQG